MLLLRAVARLTGTIWVLTLALLGLGVAMYCFDGFIRLGSARPDRLLHLPSVRRDVGHFLHQIQSPGPAAALALLCALAAMLIGLLLLLGALRSAKQRLALLDQDSERGVLAAQLSVLKAMGRALAEQAPGATSVKRPKVNLSHGGTRGKLKVTVARSAASNRSEVEQAVKDRLEPISEPFNLRPRVRVALGERGNRVQ